MVENFSLDWLVRLSDEELRERVRDFWDLSCLRMRRRGEHKCVNVYNETHNHYTEI